jgi:hypothetical protein
VILIFCKNVNHFQSVTVIIGCLENTLLPTTAPFFFSSGYKKANKTKTFLTDFVETAFFVRSKHFIKQGNDSKITL